MSALDSAFGASAGLLSTEVGSIIDKATKDAAKITNADVVALLRDKVDPEDDIALFAAGSAARDSVYGANCYVRSIIEFSNVCEKACHYCGIGRECKVDRYTLSTEQILELVDESLDSGHPGVLLQSGERTQNTDTEWLCDVVRKIKARAASRGKNDYRVILSVGELPYCDYVRLKEAGASRYLLRIEASDPKLYRTLHPADSRHSWSQRVRSVLDLKRAGYQVATGILIGVPGQTYEHIADDLFFMRDVIDTDMIGMGPYVPAEGTVTARGYSLDGLAVSKDLVTLNARCVAVSRLLMPTVNIAAVTALSALDPSEGQVMSLRAGANVLMPVLTPSDQRCQYKLYADKEKIDAVEEKIVDKIRRAGLTLVKDVPGDPVHFCKV